MGAIPCVCNSTPSIESNTLSLGGIKKRRMVIAIEYGYVSKD